ncbi:hypothetical protein [Paenibacillus tianjinensis]|uniref:Uncharacterized protein n=1 Tax=Paenibacillus tianjinensis TaxID=2810347 RepID=A0ABX7L5R4_9BACL|nr:hypothetical protein [Paenibacillus tianjinensis]QSF43445.1 hypothetical protein JRJ22_19470 [Paenibacillus tianjinensis]
MWDWDGEEYTTIPEENIVDAIYYAWNEECRVYDSNIDELVFDPFQDNKENSEMLRSYGYKLIDHEGKRRLQHIETGEIFKAPWDRD